MRRTDKEISDRRQKDEIIRGSLVCRVAMAKDNAPYVVSMSFGYDGAAIYLHAAPRTAVRVKG
ncbi:MAG: pyridoxamine 5'-phosphate oxidase family protein [Verrucomicrobiae bacterium]|nr:pyridoxamine 5'-phosphate oxidase family protein [Verrucomicrobiae bacterium]